MKTRKPYSYNPARHVERVAAVRAGSWKGGYTSGAAFAANAFITAVGRLTADLSSGDDRHLAERRSRNVEDGKTNEEPGPSG